MGLASKENPRQYWDSKCKVEDTQGRNKLERDTTYNRAEIHSS